MKKKLEFYDGLEQEQRVDGVMRALVKPTAKVPMPVRPKPKQSSAK